MNSESGRSPILIGKSTARVFKVHGRDGDAWVEKSGDPSEIEQEIAVLSWCRTWLPVPVVLRAEPGCFAMSVLPGMNLTEVSVECAVAVTSETLALIHALPAVDCPFRADWPLRLKQAEHRVRAGLISETDFDDVNQGRTAADILSELSSLPAPPAITCFTHGDACLPNFLTDGAHITGIVDLGRGGLTHPAQDWALALRSMRDNFGANAEHLLRAHLPEPCADENLLRQFRLLDELF